MHISISGHDLTVTESMEQHVKSKFLKTMQRYQKLTVIEIRLRQDAHNCTAEAFTSNSNKQISVTSTHKDMYKAINDLSNKLHRALKQQKESQLLKRKRIKKQYSTIEKNHVMDDKELEFEHLHALNNDEYLSA